MIRRVKAPPCYIFFVNFSLHLRGRFPYLPYVEDNVYNLEKSKVIDFCSVSPLSINKKTFIISRVNNLLSMVIGRQKPHFNLSLIFFVSI